MNSKTQSIVSYLGILWLVAYFSGEEKNALSRYHLKQGFGLFIVSIAFYIVVFVISLIMPKIALLVSYAGIGLFVFMILGIIHAANEVEKPLPFIGKIFEEQFNFIK